MKKINFFNPIFNWRLILLAVVVQILFYNTSLSQCTNCTANFPAGTFATTSPTLTTVNTCIYGGEYSFYSVTAGETYTWTTCGDTDFDTQLTLFSGGCAGTVLAYNDDIAGCGLQSTVTWTATFTGTVTLLVSRFNCANQNTCMTVQWACTSCAPPPGADYTHPTAGIQGEYVGACLVSDCGPFTYADNGDLGGNYSNNVATYRVFCPSLAGNCMRVTFNSFSIQNGFDDLMVINGPTQLSGVFTGAPTTASGYAAPLQNSLTGNLNGVTPFSFQSTDDSGCLGFFFISNGNTVGPGWNATLQCVPCAGGPNGTDNSDCVNMTPLCSAAPVSTNSTGPGIVAEGCTGATCPAGGENHSNWYTFTAQTSGTLNVLVTPVNPADDYDIAIYGPNVTCGALGPALRCTDSGEPGTTGASPPGVTPTQDVTGNPPFVSPLNVIAGESYILVVDKWSPALASGYTLSFSGTASLDCTVLPIELTDFNAIYQPDLDLVDVYWTTATEYNSDYFNVEKSVDGVNYEVIARVESVKNSTTETNYITVDEKPNLGVNYYRLNQFDADGSSKYSEVRAVNILDNEYDMLSVFPNPTTGITEVIFNAYSKGEAQLSVTSYDGSTIVNTPIEAKKGGNRFDLDLSAQARGVYIITITTKDKVYKTKVVKE